MTDLGKKFKEAEPYIIEMRRWFHQHPELSLKEKETSEKIKEELDKMGIPHEDLKPNYGVVATIQGKDSGKVIAARADIELNGTVKLVFQVSEENGMGYQEILDYFESIGGVDRVIGLHIWSTLPAGEILLIPGSVFAGGTGFTCRVNGQGGHGARPDLVKDPIKAACDLVLKLASIPTNFYDVLDHSVVSVGQIQSGTMGNIFPSYAEIKGTTRYYKTGGVDAIKKIMQQIADGVSGADPPCERAGGGRGRPGGISPDRSHLRRR